MFVLVFFTLADLTVTYRAKKRKTNETISLLASLDMCNLGRRYAAAWNNLTNCCNSHVKLHFIISIQLLSICLLITLVNSYRLQKSGIRAYSSKIPSKPSSGKYDYMNIYQAMYHRV